MRLVSVDETEALLSRADDGGICATPIPAAIWRDREGDSVVCPWHNSRFDLCSGEVIDGSAVFPQPRYETRVRKGNVEIKADAENVQRKIL